MPHVAPVECADAPIDRQQQRLTEIELDLANLAFVQSALVQEHTALLIAVRLQIARTTTLSLPTHDGEDHDHLRR